MAKWMLRTGALAALGLVTAMVVLATRGHPLATLPHAGGALALDFLEPVYDLFRINTMKGNSSE